MTGPTGSGKSTTLAAIANLIREGKNFQIPSAMQTGRSYGQKLIFGLQNHMLRVNRASGISRSSAPVGASPWTVAK